MRFHVLASLPRSGSTLLCNILNQNPRFRATDTSPVSALVAQLLATTPTRMEYRSMLADPDLASRALDGGVRGFVNGWLGSFGAEVVFDKDRSNVWLYQADVLRHTFPETRIVCLVRDPREVLASALARQDASPLVRDGGDPAARALGARVGALMGPRGLIGSALTAIEDVLARPPKATDHVFFVKYEMLVAHPKDTLTRLYQAIEEPLFEHDVENVVNVARDQDNLYLNLWPHEGSGRVMPRENRWPNMLPKNIANQVVRSHTPFFQKFGYP